VIERACLLADNLIVSEEDVRSCMPPDLPTTPLHQPYEMHGGHMPAPSAPPPQAPGSETEPPCSRPSSASTSCARCSTPAATRRRPPACSVSAAARCIAGSNARAGKHDQPPQPQDPAEPAARGRQRQLSDDSTPARSTEADKRPMWRPFDAASEASRALVRRIARSSVAGGLRESPANADE